jgi:hypothetical protein
MDSESGFKWNNNVSQIRPLTIDDYRKIFTPSKFEVNNQNDLIKCLICDQHYLYQNDVQKNQYLSHLLVEHKLVISDVNSIGDFKIYIKYWSERLKSHTLDEFCFKIVTNSLGTDKGEQEEYYLLSDSLPEDKSLRESLQKNKLVIFSLTKILLETSLSVPQSCSCIDNRLFQTL